MENLENIENLENEPSEVVEIITKKKKGKRLPWSETPESLSLDGIDVVKVDIQGWSGLSANGRYAIVYGIKQATADFTAKKTGLPYLDRLNAAKDRLKAFRDNSPLFLPQGHTKLTPEQKAAKAAKAKQAAFAKLYQDLIAGGMAEELARKIANNNS